MQLLNTNDANSVFAGLQCMLAICRMYRFKGGETRPEFNQIVNASFPQLHAIATRLVEETSIETWEMLHLIMKAYKHTIYVGRALASGLYHLLIGLSSSCPHILRAKIIWSHGAHYS